mmetsp:Transcript_12019/g.15661  ORF Transcript_12019/g.15661 Transcript_12019/m.15661 type:complete len:385 (+) Transcript_12019:148-1302(+)|eukprot:CAMPEP_0204870056 /NCGR_PEP_ID=MMETSP1348-20121228/31372_1 /ASSEMBLY_ACC=CAM_ASM_000700 /TAXON_ID=215587 /ORGANISM="Aplanochytrium stocchinoi, Strain GSBS06" /LENGTH=384 /DNA_ID=CAMNT_0052023665 /DNA_START=117 /DNA_END=1271 /DNA_ORIENTATION=+
MPAVRDRTARFEALTKGLSSVNVISNGSNGRKRPKPTSVGSKTFNTGSSFLARELDAVENLINLFVKEAKERSLYEDSGAVIATSTENIKSKLDTLQQTLVGLNKVATTANSSTQQRDHRLVVIRTLKSKFAKLTKDFKDNLEKRTKALASRQARQMKEFGVSKVQLKTQQRGRPNIFNPSRSQHLSKHGHDQLIHNPHASTTKIESGATSHSQFKPQQRKEFFAPPPPPAPTYFSNQNLGTRRRTGGISSPNNSDVQYVSQYQQYNPYQDQSGAQDDDKYNKPARKLQYDRSQNIKNRAVQAQHVESVITELSQVFSKVATLVSEQGELVTRIDDNLDVASTEIQAGQSELLKYYNTLSKERGLILKILAVVLAIALLFVLIY